MDDDNREQVVNTMCACNISIQRAYSVVYIIKGCCFHSISVLYLYFYSFCGTHLDSIATHIFPLYFWVYSMTLGEYTASCI